jgi:integrase
MAHSTVPKKPRKDFPLTPRGDGRWCKRVLGKFRYIKAATAQEALDEWLRVKDHWLAGREPPPKGGYLTLSDLVNQFLHHKKQRVDSGERAARTWQGYKAVGEMLVAFFGRDFAVEHLQPSDFQRLRADLAKRYNPVALGNRITVVRMIFKYGHAKGLLAKPMNYGCEFDKPDKRTIQHLKNEAGDKSLKPDEIKSLLKVAKQPMKAMILLAINGGLGPTDLALATADKFDLDGGWLNYPRPKTAQPRRVPLWPETVAAVKEAIAERHQPKHEADAKLLFIGARGISYINKTGGHHVAHEFTRLCEKAKITGHVFYDLRRTFETVADNLSRDRDGVAAIMGHSPKAGDMAAVYRQTWFEERLRSIADLVRGWLYADDKAGKPRSHKAKRQIDSSALRIVG